MISRYNKSHFAFITGLLLIVGCNETQEDHVNIFEAEPVSGVNLSIHTVELDSLKLDQIESSYSGMLSVHKESLMFFDTWFSRAFLFAENGELQEQQLGIGPGPREIPTGHITFFDANPDGGFALVGSSNDYHLVNDNFERTNTSVIQWKSEHPVEYLQNNPVPEDHRAYNLAYNLGQMRISGGTAYLPLASAPPPFSVFNLTSERYARDARILAGMNLETGEVEHIFGRLSPEFIRNEGARTFSFFSFDILPDEKFVVSYMPDSLIYITDSDFNVEKIFGNAGRGLNTDYQPFPASPNTNLLTEHWQNEFQTRGYYTSVEYIRDRDLLFRSYTKGDENMTGGLQIYHGHVLRGDVDVPKDFKVSGYIDPWFYSNAFIDEDEETIVVYRFQLKL